MDSNAAVVDAGRAPASLTLDTTGEFVLELDVVDSGGKSAGSGLTITSIAPSVVVNAGADRTAPWRSTVQLSGSVQVEPGTTAVSTWTLVSKPASSTAVLTGADTLTPSFYADTEGDFVLRLTAQTAHSSTTDDVVVTVAATRQALSYSLVDAEYSSALGRFVIVSAGPATLRLHDPSNGSETTVALSFVPKAVGVSPDGLRAAVGHSGKVSIVDLQTMTVQAEYTLTLDVNDIVFGIDNRVHCIGTAGFPNPTLQTINLANGSFTTTSSSYPDPGAKARLHPNGAAMYTSQESASPTHLYRYDVSVSPVAYSRTWPYHGQYDAGYNLWIMDDGTIIAQSGKVFYSSTDATVDMTYRGALTSQVKILWGTDAPAASGFATLGVDYDANYTNVLGYNIRTWNRQTLALQQAITLPRTPGGNTSYFSEGMFAAFDGSGTTLYTITRSNTGSGFVYSLYPVPL